MAGRPPPPAPTVGIVGGGQLARMTALAAAALDVPVAVLDEDPHAPALGAGARHVSGSHRSADDLRRLASVSAVVTFDHEGAPPPVLQALEQEGVVMRPAPAAQRVAQDKVHQRALLGGDLGLPVPPHRVVTGEADVEAFAAEVGWPVVLKLASGGYDGRGVWMVEEPAGAAEPLTAAERIGTRVLAEAHVPLDAELAVLVARSPSDERAVYPPVFTVQRDGMCREMVVPAPVPAALAREAERLAVQIAEGIDAVGILAVELFVSGGRLLVNELALRPHNSGHWSLGGARTSQFENHLRAVLDWPLGPVDAVAGAVACVNVVGPADGSDPRARVAGALAVEGAMLQLYGKSPRPGRKLGHVTALGASAEEARGRARRAAEILEGGTG